MYTLGGNIIYAGLTSITFDDGLFDFWYSISKTGFFKISSFGDLSFTPIYVPNGTTIYLKWERGMYYVTVLHRNKWIPQCILWHQNGEYLHYYEFHKRCDNYITLNISWLLWPLCFQQTVGIQTGTDSAYFLAVLFLCPYDTHFCSFSFRYIKSVSFINFLPEMSECGR